MRKVIGLLASSVGGLVLVVGASLLIALHFALWNEPTGEVDVELID